MVEEKPNEVEAAPEGDPQPKEPLADVHLEKAVNPTVEEKASESKALVVVEKEPASKKISGGSVDRDVALANLEKDKKLSFIKAWEDNEKAKAENKAQKKISSILAWENSKKTALEAQLRKIEEQLEKKKAEYGEKIKNKVGMIHKEAKEKRAMVEAKKGEELLKAEEMAAKYRATGVSPKKLLGCF